MHVRCLSTRQSPTAPVGALQPLLAADAFGDAAAKLYAAACLSHSGLRNPGTTRAAARGERLAGASCAWPLISGAVGVRIAGDFTADEEQPSARAAFPASRAIVVAEAGLSAGAVG